MRRTLNLVCIALGTAGCSATDETLPTVYEQDLNGAGSNRSHAPWETVTGVKVATPAAVIAGLSQANTRVSSTYTFASDKGDTIPVSVEKFFFEKGQLAMTGKAVESANSTFMLKGNADRIYGWVVLRDRNLAYEYTTTLGGDVVVNEVPVTKIYPICAIPEKGGHAHKRLSASTAHRFPRGVMKPPHVGPYPGTDLNALESMPGAQQVLFLDISAHMNGDTPKHISKEEMWINWQVVAASFSMYKVNVTTSRSVYQAAGVSNSGITDYLDQDGRASCALGAYGTQTACTVFRAFDGQDVLQGDGIGRTAAHEIGHLMGVNHDGGEPGGEYFEGIPAFKWVPIMGNFWKGNSWGDAFLMQWSKGEYTGANRTENDLGIIGGSLPEADDDVPDSVPLVVNGAEVKLDDNVGQIGTNTDTDTFTFTLTADSTVDLKVDRIENTWGSMLDIQAEIQDSSGAMVAEANDDVGRNASFNQMLPAGSYKLVVSPGAEGTPQNGFSTYSSMGWYAIHGTLGSGGTGGMGGTGGTGGDAGMGGMGGTAGTGGGAGVGGTAGTGGTAGMGGTAGAGGTSGTGGAGTGGTAGVSGTAGMGGSAGTGGGGAGTGGAGGLGGTSGTGGSGTGATGGTGVTPTPEPDPAGCGCRTPEPAPLHRSAFGVFGLGAGLAMALRRKRRR